MSRPRHFWLSALRASAVGFSALLLWRVFAAANGTRVLDLIVGAGAAGLLVLCPQLVALAFEALGWRQTFRLVGVSPRWHALLRVRVATEALAQSLPLGVAFAESAKPLLLAKHSELTVDQSVAGMAARKVLLLLSQCVYVGSFGALGFAGLEAASMSLIGAPGLGWLTFGAAVALGAGGALSAVALRQSALAQSVLRLLERVPLARFRSWLAGRRDVFFATDGAVSALFRVRPRLLAGAFVCFASAWFVEALETWLILRVLGVRASFVTAGSLEVILSLARNIVFVLPAGLGLQDVGYASCFAALGIPEPASVGAAFVLLKRGKELFWIAVGYGLLGSDLARIRARQRSSIAKLSPARA